MIGKLPVVTSTKNVRGKWLTIMIYGIAGVGKTSLLRSVMDLNPFLISTEPGETAGQGSIRDIDVSAVICQDMATTDSVIQELRRKDPAQYGDLPVGLTVLDSATSCGRHWEAAGLAKMGQTEIGIPQKGDGFDPRRIFGYVSERGRITMERLMSINSDLVVICRESSIPSDENTPDSPRIPVPDFPGQALSREIPGWTDATLRMRVLNGKRVFVTQIEGHAPARLRLPIVEALPKYINADLGALIRYLKGDLSAKERLVK